MSRCFCFLVPTNVQTRETRYKMVEEFSLFRSVSGLNLPHIYEIKLSVDTIHERPESLSASRSE